MKRTAKKFSTFLTVLCTTEALALLVAALGVFILPFSCVAQDNDDFPFGIEKKTIQCKVGNIWTAQPKKNYKFIAVVVAEVRRGTRIKDTYLRTTISDRDETQNYQPIGFGFPSKDGNGDLVDYGSGYEGDLVVTNASTYLTLFYLTPNIVNEFLISDTSGQKRVLSIKPGFSADKSKWVTGFQVFGTVTTLSPTIEKDGWGITVPSGELSTLRTAESSEFEILNVQKSSLSQAASEVGPPTALPGAGREVIVVSGRIKKLGDSVFTPDNVFIESKSGKTATCYFTYGAVALENVEHNTFDRGIIEDRLYYRLERGAYKIKLRGNANEWKFWFAFEHAPNDLEMTLHLPDSPPIQLRLPSK
jgi:hypothetical protein